MTDKIAVMLSSIKNASMAKKAVVELNHSKETEAIAKVLKERGFLSEVKTFKPSGEAFKKLHIELAMEGKNPLVTDVRMLSKPGKRVYAGYSDIRKVSAGYGVLVVSTSRGVMTGEEAKKKKLGGELICEVK